MQSHFFKPRAWPNLYWNQWKYFHWLQQDFDQSWNCLAVRQRHSHLLPCKINVCLLHTSQKAQISWVLTQYILSVELWAIPRCSLDLVTQAVLLFFNICALPDSPALCKLCSITALKQLEIFDQRGMKLIKHNQLENTVYAHKPSLSQIFPPNLFCTDMYYACHLFLRCLFTCPWRRILDFLF